LVLATVEYGAEETEIVVTGAPNLFEFLGKGDISDLRLFSPYALEGATLYDGHKEGRNKMKLKGRALRGIHNRSMLCSEKELGISEEHEGIIIMRSDPDSPDYRAGTPLQEVLGDVVLEIDIIPNIARCASMVGVAREYAALTGQPIRYPDYDVLMEGADANERVTITTENPELNPRFVALIIEGIKQGPSPYWMQYRLLMAGQRPISVAVDISNYVMLEMGQPNHAFDFEFLRARADQYNEDGPVHIITRLPHEGETLKTLDGKEHELLPYNILVTDPMGNLSLGGVMGGAESEIRPETTDVLLEAAAWNFINIRRTSTQLGVHSDAAFRFSRGVHPSQALLGAKRAAELLRRLAGGTVARGVIDSYHSPADSVQVSLDLAYARRLSGLDLSAEQAGTLLKRLEFEVEPVDSQTLNVTVPDHRMDIEGGHDLVEEICRMYGYGRIPSTTLSDDLPPQRGNPTLEAEERIKDSLVESGLQEAITLRLVSAELESKLIPPGSGMGPDERPYITLTNPMSPQRAMMRHSLLATVLEVAARNSRFQDRLALFEIGPIFLVNEEELLPDESTQLAIVMSGRRWSQGWHSSDSASFDFFDLKGVIEQLFGSLHLEAKYEPAVHPSYAEGRMAIAKMGKSQVGRIGELHPSVVSAFGIRMEGNLPVLAAELDLELIIPRIPEMYTYNALSPFPAVHEDIALIVSKDTAAADVEARIRHAGGYLLKDVALFDVYEGRQIPAGKKSLAYHLSFQSPRKTLTDKEVHKQRQRILKQLGSQLGARLRD
jgi:phenylalanyl-tRNA synthetase beta chain